MAFGTPVAAGFTNSAASGTTMWPAYPAGVLSTDQLVMFVGMKPATANGGTLTTPSGWTVRESLTGAGGYGSTLGADTGNTNLWVLTKDSVSQGQSGTVALTLSDNNISWSFIVRVPTGGGAISYGSSDGSDTSAGNVSVTLAANPGLSPLDFCIWAMCIPTDVTTPSQFSAHAISATGATFATPTELNEPDTNLGNDLGGFSAWTNISSGTASAAPTITATAGGTTTNVRGPLVLLRLSETVNGSLSVSETGSDSFSGIGQTLGTVSGTVAANESAGDYFFGLNVGEAPTDLFTGSVNGGWFDAEPISRFETTSSSGIALSAYGNLYGRWKDRSGNVNDLYETDFAKRGTARSELGFKSAGIYDRAESVSGGGATTGFYCCISFLGSTTLYSATIFSDINTTNTGFRLQRNGGAPGADIIFSIGTGSSRTTVTAPSGRADYGYLNVPILLEAWFDGSIIYLRVNRGVTKSALVGASAAAGNSSYLIGALDLANTDSLIARLNQIVYSKNVVPDGALRNRIAQFTAIKGNVPLDQLAPAGNLRGTEGADTFAATGTVPVSAITGLLAVTEAGTDSFAASGKVIVQGLLTATEAGSDALAATGKVIVQGALVVSEAGVDAFAASGQVIVQGTLAVSEAGADLFASTGKVVVQGSFASAEVGADTFAGSGGAFTTGTMATMETGADAFASAGKVIVQGALAASEVGSDAITSTGKVIVKGSLAVSETGTDTFTSSGGQVATGVMAVSETDADAFVSTGNVFVSGAFAAAEVGADTFIGTGGALTTGTMAATETGADLFAAVGDVFRTGTLAATEVGSDALAASGTVLVEGTFAATEVGADVFSATGITLTPIQGTFAAYELSDTAQISGQVLISALFAAAESGADIAHISGILLPFPTSLQAGTICSRMKPTTILRDQPSMLRAQPTMIRHDNNQNLRCDNSIHNIE